MSNKPYDFKDLKFSFDLKDSYYEIDVLQNKLLQSYLRLDYKFRRAFYTDYTSDFFQYLKDKARLKEPIHISVMGVTRSGKSYCSISINAFLLACHNKYMDIKYICANAMEFLEKIKTMPMEELKDSCFLIDEEKRNMMGVGSIARKLKLQDVQNIIAINNISTIMLTPTDWTNEEAYYGLRSFGRCFKTKTTRFMLYNLQEKGRGGQVPLGMVYLPIFTEFIPKPYSEELEKEYLDKKNEWVMLEQQGSGDILAEFRKKSAEKFMQDENFIKLTKSKEKLAYITYKMGSEFTTKECSDILELTKLIEQGVI